MDNDLAPCVKLPYKQNGGSCIGRNYWWAINSTAPFAEITIKHSVIELRRGWGKFEFTPENLDGIEYCPGIFTWGIRIRHHVVGYPPYIVYWVLPEKNMEPLKQALLMAGFEIKQPKIR